MGTIRKIGDDYYIEFAARGLTYQRNGGNDKAAALALLKEIEEKIRKGEAGIAVPDEPIRSFIGDVLPVLEADEDPRTFARYESAVRHFHAFLDARLTPDGRMSQITPSVIEEYRRELARARDARGRPVKPHTVNLTLMLVRNVLDKAINFGHINDNPTLHTKYLDGKAGYVPAVLDGGEIKELLRRGPREALTLLLRTGMRVEELSALTWTNVDLDKNCLTIDAVPHAPRRPRRIPLDSEGLAVLRGNNKTSGARVFDEKDITLLRGLGCRERIRIRNTFAHMIIGKGVSLTGLHRLLGFRDIARVMPYSAFLK